MIRMALLAALAAAALIACVFPASAEAPAGAETIAWDKTPITLSLPVGKERMISFPGAVQPGLPRKLASTLRVQTVADTLYITAAEGFETTRMPVREIGTGRIYLLDLKGETSAPTTPVRIAVAGEAAPGTTVTLRTTAPASTGPAPDYGLMPLTRFAAQQVYAPERLIAPLAGVTRTPVTRTVAPQIFEGAYVEVTPLASWRARNGLYVTALKLKNRLNERFDVDPRRLRGEWLATTLHHRTLGPRGADSDTTTAYVVSEERFEEAAAPWLD
ncbi:TIGR03749 family integrating conjugative element protein [Hyphococcus luteus]|uniref:TIGR03749 family integrating conjugative element protein n=1 Tax=Hyphococcus luteus TaxID=2058213 RepID=A0A2S7K042_9PROT|nr:TIGR03749 family integrating conjugative element protein [Marinicaulis flavus]PQA85867.1 TIGR03749 family integrating conjugative element protein [Marinicaulis flavus]